MRACFAVDGDAVPRRLLPDGSVDLLFNLDPVPGEPDAGIVGVATRPRIPTVAIGSRRFGVSFRCGEADRFLGAPMHLFVDRIVDLRDVLGGRADGLLDQLREQPSDAHRAALVARFLMRAGLPRPSPPPWIRRSLEVLSTARGNLPIAALAADIGVSERSLHRAFREHVGVGPKSVARILRLQSVLARIDRAPSWARLALDCGFVDQAHLIHEFRALTGTSPGQFASERSPSEFYNSSLGFAVTVAEPPRESDPCLVDPSSIDTPGRAASSRSRSS